MIQVSRELREGKELFLVFETNPNRALRKRLINVSSV